MTLWKILQKQNIKYFLYILNVFVIEIGNKSTLY